MSLPRTSGDSSDKMIAPRVSTWITFAEGKDGVKAALIVVATERLREGPLQLSWFMFGNRPAEIRWHLLEDRDRGGVVSVTLKH